MTRKIKNLNGTRYYGDLSIYMKFFFSRLFGSSKIVGLSYSEKELLRCLDFINKILPYNIPTCVKLLHYYSKMLVLYIIIILRAVVAGSEHTTTRNLIALHYYNRHRDIRARERDGDIL